MESDRERDDAEVYELAQLLDESLAGVERPGDFYATGTRTAPMPRLDVEGVGTIAFPLPQAQARELIAVARRAPYGRGDQTLVDTKVRSSWQISPQRLTLEPGLWQPTLDSIVAQVAQGLAVDPKKVSAQLYKLLVYEAGDFFGEHRDTEKADGMFATLVIVLPSQHRGGELRVRHGDREVTLALHAESPSQVAFAAFFTDCVHELRPITQGYRLALVYNLVRKGRGRLPSVPDHSTQLERTTALLERWQREPDWPDKMLLVLEHHYTSAGVSFAGLKGRDAARADVLCEAAAQAACDVHLAMVSIEESGAAEPLYDPYRYRRRRWRDDEEEEEEDFEVIEVIDRIEQITDWRTVDDEPAPIAALPFDPETELCPRGALEGEEPDEQHFHEASGNEGASFERTYRRAALVLWPRSRMLVNLATAGQATTLPLLESLIEAGEEEDADELAELIIERWVRSYGWRRDEEPDDESVMLRLLVRLGNAALVDYFVRTAFDVEPRAAGNHHGLRVRVSSHSAAALVESVPLLGVDVSAELLPALATQQMRHAAQRGVALLVELARAPFAREQRAAPLLRATARAVVEAMPRDDDGRTGHPWWQPRIQPPGIVRGLIEALHSIGDTKRLEQTAQRILSERLSYPFDECLVPALLELSADVARDTPGIDALRNAALEHLEHRIAEPLEAPTDWAQPVIPKCKCADCKALARFMADPQQSTWSFKANQQARQHVQQSSGALGCELDYETLERGRPYTLVVTKTRRAWERRVAQRKQDLAARARLTRQPRDTH